MIFFLFISFSIPYSEAMNAVTGSSPAKLPLVIGRRNTGVEGEGEGRWVVEGRSGGGEWWGIISQGRGRR